VYEDRYYMVEDANQWVCFGNCQDCANPCDDYIPLPKTKKEVTECVTIET